MSSEELPEIFRTLRNDTQLRRISHCLSEEVGVSLPFKYREIFIMSWNLKNQEAGPYAEIKNRDRKNDPLYWYETINGEVQEKFAAVYYHYTNIKSLELVVKKYCDSIIGRMKELELDKPVTQGFYLRRIIFEYESFILQCRACFEHFIHSIAYYFGFFTTNKESLLKTLNRLSVQNEKALRVYQLFRDEMPDFDVFLSKSKVYPIGYSERDKIAHVGQIQLRPLNIIFNPSTGAAILPIGKHDDTRDLSNQQNLSDAISSLMDDLFQFISKIYSVIFKQNCT